MTSSVSRYLCSFCVRRLGAVVLVLWLGVAVGLSTIAMDDRLAFFFLRTRLGTLAHIFWWIYLFCAPFALLGALFLRSLKRAATWVGVLLVAAASFIWGTPIDDGVIFRSRLPAYRTFLARAADGKCSVDEAWKLGVPLDAMACDQPRLFVFPWDGFLSAWHGLVYDESDEIAKLPGERSTAWKTREAAKLLSCVGVDAAVGGHFYVASGLFAC